MTAVSFPGADARASSAEGAGTAAVLPALQATVSANTNITIEIIRTEILDMAPPAC
jgi:hypothetical protein